MADRHFACTVCGQCCKGWLPLTLDEARAHADRFPLALVWTPVRQGAASFDVTARLGATARLPNRKTVAVRLAATAYIPPAWSCPELGEDMRCRIHETKPLRCRAMPFLAWRDEADQADLLTPRAGWTCDISAEAPVVYRDKRILDRDAFDAERQGLLRQAPLLRAHAEASLGASPGLLASLGRAVGQGRAAGHVVTPFASLFPRLPRDTVADIARAQAPLLADWAARAAGQTDLRPYHRHYTDWAAEMERVRAALGE